MGVYDNLIKKKVIKENEDGSISLNREEMNNIYTPVDTEKITGNNDNIVNRKNQVVNYMNHINNISNPNLSMWDRIKNMASSSGNTTNNAMDSINMIARTQLANNAYKEQQKEATKNTLEYYRNKRRYPNMPEDELLEYTKQTIQNNENKFNENFKNMSETDRRNYINNLRRMLPNTTLKPSSNEKGFEFVDNTKQNKQLINNLLLQSEKIEGEKKAERVNKALSEGNFFEKVGTATGELASSMGKSAVDMTIAPIVSIGSLAEGILPTNNPGPKFDDVIDFKKRKDYGESVKNANIDSDMLKAGKGVSSTIGGMIPSIIANVAMPGSNIGMITQASGVAGQDYIENLNDDKTNKIQSAISGTLKGLGSYATEKITGGNILGSGSLDDWATKTIASKTSNKVAQKIASKIYEVGGENLEELLENQIDHIVDVTVNNKGTSFKDWLNEQSETVKQTTLTQLFLNLMGVGGDTYKEVQNQNKNLEANKWINEAQKIIDKENINFDNLKVNNQNLNEVKSVLNKLPIDTSNNQQNAPNQQTILPTQENALNQNVVKNNQLPTQENTINLPTQNNLANNKQILYNDIKIGETRNIDIDDISNLIDDGGYRTETQINDLRKDIIKNGITTPIEIYRKNDGTIAIENGNHRLKIAQELEMKNIPVKMVESWENIGLNKNYLSEENIKEAGGIYNDRTREKTNIVNETSRNRVRSMYNNNEQSQKFGTTKENVNILTKESNSNEQTSSNGSKENNRKQLENSNKSSFNLPQKEKANLPTQGEKINWNEVEKPEGKFRKHYQSIIESSNTTAEAKAIAKELMGTDTYVPESNKNLIKKADAKINTTNPNTELSSLYSKVMNNEKVTDVDIAVGERLIEYYSKIGDSEHLLDAIHATSMAGTQAGRTVQAMALLNHMTPHGQVVWMQRSIDKANNELQQKYHNKKDVPQFKLTQEMTDKILNTDSTEEMFNTIDEVYEELGQQVPKSMSEKIDEWRYFSMLANVKTHARNILGNVAMHYTQRTKDKLAGVIEGTVAKFNPEMERTHTIVPANKEVKQFAKNDLNNRDIQTQLGINEDKYNPQSRLQRARRTFKSDLMENTLGKLFDVNSKALEVEDNIGLKAMYVKTLGEYITANKLDINNMTDAQLNKARQHAIKEAKEATFHQASSLATALQQMGNKNNLTKFALDAVVPFKKTPINVAKTGAQYSPIGLIKSAIFDVNKVRKGTMTANQYIDNISKGLTGTGITFLGYVLAESGILKASGGDDDKKEKYDEEQGKQSYALEIGGNTYSLDWLSPVGIPLFIGAETNQQFKQTKKEKNTKSSDDENVLSNILQGVANVANGASNAMNPMSEMSMVSGLTSVLSSYNKENAVGDMLVNTGKSYVNQFVPTLLGQVARTTDDYERSTKSTKTGTLEKAVDSTINQIKSKIPGLRQTLPTKTDIWGQDVKQSENLPFRAFNNFINPAKVQDVSTDIVDKELNNLYSKTRESSIIPKSIDKVFSINGTDYRLTNDEYAQYNKTYGKTAHNLLEKLIQTDNYKSLADAQKQKVIENIYSYAKENNKVNYSNKVKENLDTSSLYKTIQDLKNNGGDVSSYLSYKGKVADIQGENETMQKNIILRDSNYDNKTKSIIYKNNTGKDDKLYSLVPDINMNQYLAYKAKSSNEEFKADKDSNGKTISGSAKKKLEQYLKQNITGPENRLVILGSKYKLSKTEQQRIVDYISKISKTNEEAVEKLGKLGNNFLLKDGKAYFK